MPTAEIVAEGVQLAIEYARDGSAARPPQVKVFEPSLIVRQSTAPPADAVAPDQAGRGSSGRASGASPAVDSARIARRRFITSFSPRPK